MSLPIAVTAKRHGTMRKTIGLLAALTICAFRPAIAAEEAPSVVCEREMIKASRTHDVPLAVLYAVGLTETGRRGSLQPFAMNVEGKAIFARDLPDALKRFAGAQRDGAVLIDIGCMQINHHFHGDKFRSLAQMFDPARNVAYAAQFLRTLYAREKTWTLAVARYHAGPNNDPAQKRYVCAVMANMVATGLGRWTPAAGRFCNGNAVAERNDAQ